MARSSSPGVEARVRRALELIESAQNDLSRASAELSAVIGAIPMWRRTAKLSDACKRTWYELEQRDRRRWALDGMHSDEDVEEANRAADARSDADPDPEVR
jgi:hypothetical protein